LEWACGDGTGASASRGRRRAQEAEEKDPDRSVVPWLKHLGCGLEDAREAAAYCATMPPEATMEERIRAALRFLSARRGRVAGPETQRERLCSANQRPAIAAVTP